MSIKKFLFSLIFLSWVLPVKASTYFDHVHVQFAGQIGLLSGGVGRKITPRYSLGLMYGYVPAGVAKGTAIETFALRQNYQLFDWHQHELYLGLNAFHVVGIRYETSRYGEAPQNYYSIGSIRGLIYLGYAFDIFPQKKIKCYFETGINDIWLEHTLANYPAINPLKHMTMALGLLQEF